METQKNQVAERLKEATNILVAVSTNPTVDQLAGAIGLTLLLNKLNKHATAVFSGGIPSTLEFLQPEKTLEKNTDSLRDFIIALDKSKADKLRYKVEDQMVKIFITPYMTSLSEKDLEFSQGDFNVDVIIGLGVNEQQDLDQAITSNGRILHDATVVSVSNHPGGSLGSINWVDEAASSLCEMLTQLGLVLKPDILDGQMATALLTGIVAETNRFSNEKTSSETMQVSAKLMTAGANQQLVASQLQQPLRPEEVASEHTEHNDIQLPEIQETDDAQPPEEPTPPNDVSEEPVSVDGTLDINHGEIEEPETEPEAKAEKPSDETQELTVDQIHIDEEGTIKPAQDSVAPTPSTPAEQPTSTPVNNRLIMEPPTHGGTLTANGKDEGLEPGLDILGAPTNQGPILSHGNDNTATDEPPASVPLPSLPTSEPPHIATVPQPVDDSNSQTLAELEELVTNSRVPESTENEQTAAEGEKPTQPASQPHVDAARDAVSQAMSGVTPQILEPVQSLNAQPMDLNLGDMPAVTTSLESAFASNSSAPSFDSPPTTTPISPPPASSDSANSKDVDADDVNDDEAVVINPTSPPPVPPPMMPPGQFSS